VRVGLARRKQRTLSRMGNGVNSRLPATDAYAEPAHTILFIDAWVGFKTKQGGMERRRRARAAGRVLLSVGGD